jgi:hypothetical protein
MKRLFRKRWFRITMSIVLALGLLVAWGYHVANVRGAAEWQAEDFGARKGLGRLKVVAYPMACQSMQVAARALARRDLMLTACGVERYYGEHRSYPASLAALPAGTAIDPLDGGSFLYGVEPKDGSFLLYSKGPDGTDEGGKGKRAGGVDWGW